jgi:methyl-accepting chemotaxis protein
MTIGRQILAGYAALLALILVLVVTATTAVGNVSDAKDAVINRGSVLVSRAHELDAIVSEESAVNRGFYLSRNENDLARLTDLEASYRAVTDDITAKTDTAAGRGLLQQIQSAKEAWTAASARVVAAARTGSKPEEVARLFEQGPAPARESLRALVRQLVDRESAAIRVGVRRANDRADRSLLVLWVLAGVSLALALVIAGWITRRVSGRLGAMSHQVDGAAGEILAGTTQQVTGFSEQAAAVQQTVVTVDELVQTAEQSAERARMVAERAHQSAEVARAGIQAVEGSAEGMRTIREQVHSIAQSVVSLAERAQAISEIIEAVNDIAEQTHLLALNAAIEAARAGEHGRGFGVVAAEVKVLADQSRRATAQVAGILGEIQRGTNTAVMLTESGTKSVDEGTRLVAQAGTTIEDLAETVATATVAAEQIAASSNQQAVATAQISHAMKDVDTVMEQNLASARQSEQTAKALTGVAAEMKALVGAV